MGDEDETFGFVHTHPLEPAGLDLSESALRRETSAAKAAASGMSATWAAIQADWRKASHA